MFFRTITVALCAALAVSGSAQAADDKDDAAPLLNFPCQTHDKAAEAAAQTVADKFTTFLNKGDRPGILNMVPEMEAVMAVAPAPYYAERCDTTITVYTSNMSASLMIGVMAAGGKDDKTKTNINLSGPTPYATLAFGLGWAYADRRDYGRCITVLEDGLKRDPFDEAMIAEHLFCLAQAGRNEETIAAADKHLGNFMLALSDPGKAAILRRKGYALIELGRWDEAEKAYKESLKLDPKNEIAKNELIFIKEQKKKQKAS
ncbi:tetratricopeptide repeat protein [Asticcacaulis sp. BYS171W]|uniref:Tetratricopeptide repeat protein n=1 Tax=Asticcacaulis aquaticus TaxID=2984212 RepID=A0ABT5HXK3_9CAUL|nr:tetratricopeptide repeat protein [Asticcacaulis aquaticus]MDC7684796.1 tetratricopeptide repeat protein [Asticcacaulis aquaticus]